MATFVEFNILKIMFSVIICSISPKRLDMVKQNIRNTIGQEEVEFIGIDNREMNWPIAKVYNFGAKQARYPNLFFVHEDVEFLNRGWGSIIESKLSEPDCGVIGFAGSKVKLNVYSGWPQYAPWEHTFNYRRVGGLWANYGLKHYIEHPFEETLILDGLGMFVRKDVWELYPFDEVLLTGFHCYDIDFSLQIASRYKNYICCSPLVMIEHFSNGSYDSIWYAETIKMHKAKWSKVLPAMRGIDVSAKILKKCEERVFYRFVRNAVKNKDVVGRKQLLKEFMEYSFSYKHFIHCLVCCWHYLRINYLIYISL